MKTLIEILKETLANDEIIVPKVRHELLKTMITYSNSLVIENLWHQLKVAKLFISDNSVFTDENLKDKDIKAIPVGIFNNPLYDALKFNDEENFKVLEELRKLTKDSTVDEIKAVITSADFNKMYVAMHKLNKVELFKVRFKIEKVIHLIKIVNKFNLEKIIEILEKLNEKV